MSRLKLFKWPLTYLVIIIAVIAYINREALFEADSEQPASVSGEFVSDEQEGGVAEDNVVEVPATAIIPVDAEAEVVEPEAAEPQAGDDETPVVETVAPATTPEMESPQDIKPNASMPPVSDTAVVTLDPGQLWQQARAQVWAGQYERAIEQYQQLIELQPANYDAHGELGDLYLGMRRYEEAGSSYLEAGRQLIAAGYGHSAWRLLPMLNDIAPEKAAELHRLLQLQTPAAGMMP